MKKKSIYILSLLTLILTFILCGCGEKCEKADIFAMDTVMSFELYGDNAKEALEDMKKEIRRLDEKYSPSNIPERDTETEYIESVASSISELTEESFNLKLAELMEIWGFRGEVQKVPSDTEIQQAMKNDKNDYGGILKGYASDRIFEIAKMHKIKSGIVSLGGSVLAIGKRPDGKKWRVAVTNPQNTEEYVGYVEVENRAVVTSGAYMRYFEENGKKYHHILNPRTGNPADSGISSVTIISERGIEADALSTALFVGGEEQAKNVYSAKKAEFEAILIKENGEIVLTDNADFIKTERN